MANDLRFAQAREVAPPAIQQVEVHVLRYRKSGLYLLYDLDAAAMLHGAPVPIPCA